MRSMEGLAVVHDVRIMYSSLTWTEMGRHDVIWFGSLWFPEMYQLSTLSGKSSASWQGFDSFRFASLLFHCSPRIGASKLLSRPFHEQLPGTGWTRWTFGLGPFVLLRSRYRWSFAKPSAWGSCEAGCSVRPRNQEFCIAILDPGRYVLFILCQGPHGFDISVAWYS